MHLFLIGTPRVSLFALSFVTLWLNLRHIRESFGPKHVSLGSQELGPSNEVILFMRMGAWTHKHASHTHTHTHFGQINEHKIHNTSQHPLSISLFSPDHTHALLQLSLHPPMSSLSHRPSTKCSSQSQAQLFLCHPTITTSVTA